MSDREEILHVVDRWGRLAPLWFLGACILVTITVGALKHSPTMPPPGSFAGGFFVAAVMFWFLPVGRYAYVSAVGIVTLRMGRTVLGRTLHKPADITRLELAHGRFFDAVILHSRITEPVLLTRYLRLGRNDRAEKLIAKVESILGRTPAGGR